MKPLFYAGDCCTILEDETSPFGDATEMANCVENAMPSNKKEMKSLCAEDNLKMEDYGKGAKHLFYNGEWKIFIVYNAGTDIHYFFS